MEAATQHLHGFSYRHRQLASQAAFTVRKNFTSSSLI
jgi:hypothetical protein